MDVKLWSRSCAIHRVQQRREQLSRRLKDTQPDDVDTTVGMQGHGENRSSSIGRKVGQCQRRAFPC